MGIKISYILQSPEYIIKKNIRKKDISWITSIIFVFFLKAAFNKMRQTVPG
jgi:hypothetical protein